MDLVVCSHSMSNSSVTVGIWMGWPRAVHGRCSTQRERVQQRFDDTSNKWISEALSALYLFQRTPMATGFDRVSMSNVLGRRTLEAEIMRAATESIGRFGALLALVSWQPGSHLPFVLIAVFGTASWSSSLAIDPMRSSFLYQSCGWLHSKYHRCLPAC
jgi:hypothetical protein